MAGYMSVSDFHGFVSHHLPNIVTYNDVLQVHTDFFRSNVYAYWIKSIKKALQCMHNRQICLGHIILAHSTSLIAVFLLLSHIIVIVVKYLW